MPALHLIDRTDRPRLAVRFREGAGPAVLFLPGYKSDMEGAKAQHLDRWAARTGRPLLRMDYTGCGLSEGRFADETLATWRDDVLALVDMTEGPLVLVGSSMGGWLMLLVALARPDRVKALVGIAAAPDFTDWGFTQDEKMTILREGRIARPSAYGEPLVTTGRFWQSGEANRLLGRQIGYGGPVRLIHGQADRDVPWDISNRLSARLGSADVQLTLVKDGDHRLSRPQDLALIEAVVALTVEAL